MTEEAVRLNKNDGVATLILNRPEQLNALNGPMLSGLCAALDDCAADAEVRVLIITGAGRGFCAGADLKPGSLRDPNRPRSKTPSKPKSDSDAKPNPIAKFFNPVIEKLIDLPVPTIAAVNGVAAGGGYGIALSCDLVLAAQSAEFVLVFTPQLGIIPDMGASWHAPRLLGRAKAIALTFFGEPVTAAEAVQQGLIWKCLPDDELLPEAGRLAEKLKRGPTLAYREVRRAFDRASSHSLVEHLQLEADVQLELVSTEDYKEGVRAFGEKRPPKFTGR